MDFCEDDDPLTREDVEAIREALEDIREGRLFTDEEVKEKLGLKKERPYHRDLCCPGGEGSGGAFRGGF
jgi:hypothetical protein